MTVYPITVLLEWPSNEVDKAIIWLRQIIEQGIISTNNDQYTKVSKEPNRVIRIASKDKANL